MAEKLVAQSVLPGWVRYSDDVKIDQIPDALERYKTCIAVAEPGSNDEAHLYVGTWE